MGTPFPPSCSSSPANEPVPKSRPRSPAFRSQQRSHLTGKWLAVCIEQDMLRQLTFTKSYFVLLQYIIDKNVSQEQRTGTWYVSQEKNNAASHYDFTLSHTFFINTAATVSLSVLPNRNPGMCVVTISSGSSLTRVVASSIATGSAKATPGSAPEPPLRLEPDLEGILLFFNCFWYTSSINISTFWYYIDTQTRRTHISIYK